MYKVLLRFPREPWVHYSTKNSMVEAAEEVSNVLKAYEDLQQVRVTGPDHYVRLRVDLRERPTL